MLRRRSRARHISTPSALTRLRRHLASGQTNSRSWWPRHPGAYRDSASIYRGRDGAQHPLQKASSLWGLMGLTGHIGVKRSNMGGGLRIWPPKNISGPFSLAQKILEIL